MPDTVENGAPIPYDPVMEARVSRLEEDMREVKASNHRLEFMVSDLRVGMARIEAVLTSTLPHLATKAELAEVLATLPHLSTKAEVAEIRDAIPHLAMKVDVAEIRDAIPRLATKEELADKPGKTFLVGLLAILLAAYAAGLAALAVLK